MFSHSKSSPPRKLTAYPQLGWTRYSNTGGSIHGGGLRSRLMEPVPDARQRRINGYSMAFAKRGIRVRALPNHFNRSQCPCRAPTRSLAAADR